MARSVVPTLKLPTGYEGQQRAIDRKRKLAELLMQQGISPLQGATSWLQPLGQIAQIWAAKSMERGAENAAGSMDSMVAAQRQTAVDEFNKDVGQLESNPDALPMIIQKHAGNPMLEDLIKPYMEAYQARLRVAQGTEDFGGQRRRTGSIPIGTPTPMDPKALTYRDENGQIQINQPALAAQQISNGFGPEGLTLQTTMPDTTVGGLSNRSKQSLEEARQSGIIAMQQAANKQPIRPPDGFLDGKPYWMVNGVAFDNPEGN